MFILLALAAASGAVATSVLLLLFVRSRRLPHPDRTWLGMRNLLASLVERRFGGYRHAHTVPDPRRPARVPQATRVAVVGGGLAGIAAASTLAERGVEVVLFDKNPYLGGKIGAWRGPTLDGSEREIEHGFHAFFRHYYNLNDFLDRLQIREHFDTIEDYQIVGPKGQVHSYAGLDTVPVLNLLSLGAKGAFSWWDILRTQALHEMDRFLLYDESKTFAELDHVPFDRFAERAELPASLMLSFNSFSRAFFADPDRLSTAELIKSFHFYYLSQDAGLIYDFPTDHYERAVLAPIRAHLDALGVELRLDTPVEDWRPEGAGFVVQGAHFDGVVLATDVVGTAKLASASWLDDGPAVTRDRLRGLQAGQRYAVVRLWLDGEPKRELSRYVVVDRQEALDAVAFNHRMQAGCRAWAEETGGSVIELHSYAVPDAMPDEDIRNTLVREFFALFPDAARLAIVTEHTQVRSDFPAFHAGLHAGRPGTETEVDGLVLAGDWVKLPFPACLMEAAFTSGVLAANALLRRAGAREAPVWQVPPQGLLVGLPEAPGKKRVRFD